jgi:chromosomal replication initiation ATPase DnaA
MRQTVIRHGSCPDSDDEGFGDYMTVAETRADAKRGSRRLRMAILRVQKRNHPKHLRPRVRDSYGSWEERRARFAEIDRVKKLVAAHFGIPEETMTQWRGPQKLVEKRHVAMLLAREVVRSSYPDIAMCYGKKDHTTVIHACRVISANPALAPHIAKLRKALEA